MKNTMQRLVGIMTRLEYSNSQINEIVAVNVDERGPIGTGRYACTCNNWGPRWMENSADPCCLGCYNWAMDHHYEVPTSDLDPNRVTTEMIRKNTWGINVKQLDKNRANRLIDKALKKIVLP